MPHSSPESQPTTELDPAIHRSRPARTQPVYGSGPLGAGLIPVGAVLGDRYRVVRLLAQGGFGRTYLAEDLQRFSESCVLKEFAPQVQGDENLRKAQDLFEREAGVLYRLEHDQIPRFRELRQTTYNDQPYLLLIQDFVPGWTYRERLDDRQQHGKTLSEAEVALMLKQLLPVLAYLHARGVIHRDIAPDNLIQRDRDGLPVLIDFGAVKQAAVTIINEFSQRPDQGTRLGKLGYAPPEQMQQGAVFPHSDIYALGATALTLLSGEEPHQLMDPDSLDWTWGNVIHLSPGFAAVLNRMVALRPRDRYPSAKAALRDLERLEALPNRPVPTMRGAVDSVAPAPTMLPQTTLPGAETAPPKSPLPRSGRFRSAGAQHQPTHNASLQTVAVGAAAENLPSQSLPRQSSKVLGAGLLLSGLGFLAGVLLWQRPIPAPSVVVAPIEELPNQESENSIQPAVLSEAEVERLNAIDQRRQALGIPSEFWAEFMDEQFAQLNPALGGRKLTPEPEDQVLRDDYAMLSDTWLNRLEGLGAEQRSRLGTYSNAEFEQWVSTAAAQLVNRAEFTSLVNQALAQQLPELTNQEGEGPVQLKRAIASAVITDLQNRSRITTLTIDPAGNAYQRASLQPGEATLQRIQLRQGQNLRLSLDSPASVKLAVYRPGQAESPWVPGLTNQYWEGMVPETGQYQIRITSNAGVSVEYGLNAIVE